MAAIVAAILYNFRNLIRFSGRDTRAQFWPYVIFIFIVQSIISVIIMIPIMINMMAKIFLAVQQQAAKPHAPLDQRAIDQIIQGLYSDMGSVLTITSPILTGLLVALIAAAVTRRLHDRNMHGYWGLVPLPFTIVGLAAMPKMFATWPYRPDFGLFGLLLLNSLIHLAAIIVLIVLLAQRSVAGANRFGAEVTDWHHSP